MKKLAAGFAALILAGPAALAAVKAQLPGVTSEVIQRGVALVAGPVIDGNGNPVYQSGDFSTIP